MDVFILCGGNQTRWKGHCFKQLLEVGGEPILHRTVRMVRERGHEPFIVTQHEELKVSGCLAGGLLIGTTIVDTFRSIMAVCRGPTVVLLGDVFFTEKSMDLIFGGIDFQFFLRSSASRVKPWGEIFAIRFGPNDLSDLWDSTRSAVDAVIEKKGKAKMWAVYFQGGRFATEIDDGTDDFDRIEEYKKFISQNRGLFPMRDYEAMRESLRLFREENPLPADLPLVSVVVPSRRFGERYREILHTFDRQTYPRKELIVVCPARGVGVRGFAPGRSDVRVITTTGQNLGMDLNSGFDAAKGVWLTKMDDDDVYFEEYLSDTVRHATRHGVGFYGKCASFVLMQQEKKMYFRPTHATSWLHGGTLFFHRDVFEKVRFSHVAVGEDTKFENAALRAGFRKFVTDPFNFAYVRWNESHHTWRMGAGKSFKAEMMLEEVPGTVEVARG